MRCLYCGNELPVLRKWTGGGEFCSDAHRQKYQEEYDRLALNRLLQARPTEENQSRPPVDALAEETEVAVPPQSQSYQNGSRGAAERRPERSPELVAQEKLAGVLRDEEAPRQAEPPKEPEAVAPAGISDFLFEIPEPLWWDSADVKPSETAAIEPNAEYRTPAGMDHLVVTGEPRAEGDLVLAGAYPLEVLENVAPHKPPAQSARESRIEAKEFTRSAPKIEIPKRESQGRLAVSQEPFAFEPGRVPAPPPPTPWQPGELVFRGLIEFEETLSGQGETTGFEMPAAEGEPDPYISIPAPQVLAQLEAASEAPAAGQMEDLRSFLPAGTLSALAAEPMAAPEPPAAEPIATVEREDALVVEEAQTEVFELAPAEVQSEAEAVPEPGGGEMEAAETVSPVEAGTATLEGEPESAPVGETAGESGTEPAAVETATPAKAPVPVQATVPAEVVAHAVVPVPARVSNPFGPMPLSGLRVQLPRATALPLRPVIVLGPPPAPAKAAEPAAPAVPAAPPAAAEQPAAAGAPNRDRQGRGATRQLKIRNRPASITPAVKVEPQAAGGEVSAKSAPAEATQAIEPAAAKPVAEAKPAVTAPKQEPDKDKKAAPAPPAAKQQEERPAAAKPEAPPKAKQETPQPKAEPAEAATPAFGDGVPKLSYGTEPEGFFARIPTVLKVGVIGVALAAGAFFAISNMSKPSQTGKASGDPYDVAGPGMLAAEGGWNSDWTGEANSAKRQRQVSIYRPSMTLSDYRVELQGQIDSKALGIVYRASNPQNYYVAKLEIVKPGLTPQVALVRYAVINGEDQVRAQIPLSMPLRIDTMYKVRLDVRANLFTLYVQDQKVDQWSDDRLKVGGVGLINERGELSQLKAVIVTPLAIKK